MKRADWIRIHDGSRPGRATMELECTRCGERYAPAMPIPVDLLVALGKAFEKMHRGCQPR